MFKKLFKTDETEEILSTENKQLRRKTKVTIKELESVQAERDEIKDKYIALLEEKGTGFNQYLHYYDLYSEAYATLKENKREIAELKMEIKGKDELIAEFEEKELKLEKESNKLKKKIDKLTTVEIEEEQNEKDKK